jgi:uncharacterized protein YutE (UPF0331/DUF86 family)
VLRLLRAVSDDMAFLRRESRWDAARRADPVWLRGVKYTFVTAIEACVDAAQHICSSEGWGPPRDNGDAMSLWAATTWSQRISPGRCVEPRGSATSSCTGTSR